jgi:hypothetical protein
MEKCIMSGFLVMIEIEPSAYIWWPQAVQFVTFARLAVRLRLVAFLFPLAASQAACPGAGEYPAHFKASVLFLAWNGDEEDGGEFA